VKEKIIQITGVGNGMLILTNKGNVLGYEVTEVDENNRVTNGQWRTIELPNFKDKED